MLNYIWSPKLDTIVSSMIPALLFKIKLKNPAFSLEPNFIDK